MRPLGLHDCNLLVGREFGMNRVEVQPDRDRFRHVAAVSCCQNDADDPETAQALDHQSRLRAQPVRQHQESGKPAVDGHSHHDGSHRVLSAGQDGAGIWNPLGNKSGSAHRDPSAVHDSFQPLARDLPDLRRGQEVETSRVRFQDEGPCDDVLRGLVERRCQLEELLGG